MEPASNNPTTELGSDRPIESKTQDKLGRAKFAENLARAITNWAENESLVIAICGEWGIGKSSLKNLVLEQLRTAASSAPDIIQFSPWQWTGHETISVAFFRELLVVLSGKSDKSTKKVTRTLRRYAAYLGLFRVFFGGPRGVLSIALGIFGLLVIVPPQFIATEHARIFITICGAAALAVAASMAWGEEILKHVAACKEFSGAGDQTLDERKQDVASALLHYGRTLVVVIDDVDRLTKTEIQSVFQLIKANADFPRFVYLVMFQRDIVESALSELTEEGGRHFLEKIVHVSFDVPRASQPEVDRVLGEGLERVLGTEASRGINEVYWGNVYFGALRNYFRDLRDVKRFLGSFEFHANLLRTNRTLEVNAVDLIAIEALRLFDPDFYRAIQNSKGLLTAGRSLDSSDRTRVADDLKAIVASVKQLPDKLASELLSAIFPTAAFAFGGTGYSSEFRVEWKRDLRICASEFFDRYFQLGIPQGEISQSQLERVISLGADHAALRKELEALLSNGQLVAALDRLDFNKDKFVQENVLPTLTALFDISEKLPEPEPTGTINDPDWSVIRIAYAMLKKESANTRVSVVEEMLKATVALRAPMRFVGAITPSPERVNSSTEVLIPEAAAGTLYRACVEKIKSTAAEGRLLSRHDLAYVLYRWRAWGSESDARAWSKSVTTASPDGALAFLRGFLHKGSSHTAGDHVSRITYSMKYTELEHFVDIGAIEQEINKLPDAKLSENDRRVLDNFRKAVARKRAGKAESDFASDDD
jgi:predicted KAP-like P-loop ATPase